MAAGRHVAPRKYVGARKIWGNWERGQLARWVRAGKLPALPVVPALMRANENTATERCASHAAAS